MQQMTYMGYRTQQQTPQAPMLFANSILPMVPGSPFNHWHVTREDFQMVTGDKAIADYLRDLENQTTYIVNKLRDEGRLPQGQIPHQDDLWVIASPGMAETRTLNAWGHAKYDECIPIMIKQGWVKTRWIAPLEHTMGLFTTVCYDLFDGKAYIVINDVIKDEGKKGDYLGSDGEIHNVIEEGQTLGWKIRREFLLCTEKIQAAQYSLVGLDPPEPLPRCQPLTRRREPQKNDASANIHEDATDRAREIQTISHAWSQGGTLKDQNCETQDHLQNTTSSLVESTIRRDFSTNVPESSADSKLFSELSEAPWCVETLISLAQSRHRQGLFEVTGTAADQEAAEKLLRETEAMGLGPSQAWSVIDQHIMAMMDGPTWWATKRVGKIKRFGLDHVVRHWATVAQDLTREPWSPLDTVPYLGPPLLDDDLPAYGAGYEIQAEPTIIEGSLEDGQEDIQGYDEPRETEEMTYTLPSVTEPLTPHKRGMTIDEYNALFVLIKESYPQISTGVRELSDGSLALAIEYAENRWMPVRNEVEWRTDPLIRRLVADAVRYGDLMQLREEE